MPPQTLTKRLERLLSDAASGNGIDLHARWSKIAETVGADAASALGPIPEPTLEDIPLQDAVQYSARDADATLRAHAVLSAKIQELGLQQALDLDIAVTPMIVRMQQNGMLVDRQHLSVLNDAFTSILMDLEHRCYELAGRRFLCTSGDQVAEILYEDLGLKGGRLTKSRKRLSTDEKSLEMLRGKHPIIPLLQEHREISKLQSSYVEVLPKLLSPDGRIRMELGMVTVPSGRLNCWGGVNLLAIPVRTDLGREIRRSFIAPEGCRLASIDLSQIELRAVAILSNDANMLDAFANDKDLHALTASALCHVPLDKVTFNQRDIGKRVNFATAYGITALGLYERLIVSGVTEFDEVACQKMLDDWYSFYSAVRPWHESIWAEGRRNGYIRDTLSGRIQWLPGLRSPLEKVRSEAERVAQAFLPQTFAQVILKLGMVQMWDFLQSYWQVNDYDRLEPLLQVHDEILLECSTDIEADMLADTLVGIVTEAAPKLPIPIKAACHFGPTWESLK